MGSRSRQLILDFSRLGGAPGSISGCSLGEAGGEALSFGFFSPDALNPPYRRHFVCHGSESSGPKP